MASAGHLAARFFGSLLPIGPAAADAAWAEDHLGAGELALWRRMSPQDRRHAAGVARRADELLGGAPAWALTAALLHDVGKVDSRLGTFGRVVATLSAKAAGHDMARTWSRSSGITRRIGLYLLHPELGGTLLALAGADERVRTWAVEHHQPEDTWTLPPDVARALKAADGD